MRKKVGIIKRVFCFSLVFLLSINSFAAIVSDNDGAAFITKAEFDALKNDFQSQIDQYNQSIDSKIDGSIAAYLAGIQLSTDATLESIYASNEDGLFFTGDDWLPDLPSINCTWSRLFARWYQPRTMSTRSGTIFTEFSPRVESSSNNLFIEWNTTSNKGVLKFCGDAILSGSMMDAVYGTGTFILDTPDVAFIPPFNNYGISGDSGFLDYGRQFMIAPKPSNWNEYFKGTLGSISDKRIYFWNWTKNDGSVGNWGWCDPGRDQWEKRGAGLINVSSDRASAMYGGSSTATTTHVNSHLYYEKNKFKPTAVWYNELGDDNLHPLYDWNLKTAFIGFRSFPYEDKLIIADGNKISAADCFIFDNQYASTPPFNNWVYTTIGQEITNCQPTYVQGTAGYYGFGGNFGALPALTTKTRFNEITYDGSWVDSSLSSTVAGTKINTSIPLFYTKDESEYTIPLTFTDTAGHWVWLSKTPIPASFRHTDTFTNNLDFSTTVQSNGASLIGKTGEIKVKIPANTLVYIKAAKAVANNNCSCEIEGPIIASYAKAK